MFRYDQFQDACCWEKKKSPKVYQIFVFDFPTINVFLERDRARS